MTDYDARQRIITELAADGGLSADKVATEVLFYLPPSFLTQYETLFWQAFKPQGSTPVGSRGDGIVEKTTKGVGGPSASGGGKQYKEYWVIISDKAYRKKLRIDQKLTDIGNSLLTWDQTKATSITCSNCSRFLDRTFKFCPSCGSKAPRD